MLLVREKVGTFLKRVRLQLFPVKSTNFSPAAYRKFSLFILKRAPSRSWKTQREIFICCPIYTNFYDLQRPSSTLSSCEVSVESEKLCRFKYWLLCEGQKERNFDGSPEKNSYFFPRRVRIKLFSKMPLLFHDLVACQISTFYEH